MSVAGKYDFCWHIWEKLETLKHFTMILCLKMASIEPSEEVITY